MFRGNCISYRNPPSPQPFGSDAYARLLGRAVTELPQEAEA